MTVRQKHFCVAIVLNFQSQVLSISPAMFGPVSSTTLSSVTSFMTVLFLCFSHQYGQTSFSIMTVDPVLISEKLPACAGRGDAPDVSAPRFDKRLATRTLLLVPVIPLPLVRCSTDPLQGRAGALMAVSEGNVALRKQKELHGHCEAVVLGQVPVGKPYTLENLSNQ